MQVVQRRLEDSCCGIPRPVGRSGRHPISPNLETSTKLTFNGRHFKPSTFLSTRHPVEPGGDISLCNFVLLLKDLTAESLLTLSCQVFSYFGSICF